MDLQVGSDFSPNDSGILVPLEIDVWTNQYPNALWSSMVYLPIKLASVAYEDEFMCNLPYIECVGIFCDEYLNL